MNSILPHIDPSIAYALAWTIIHSLWQASLIALSMSLIHKFGRTNSASFRYNVSVISMLAVFVLSAATFGYYYGSSPQHIESATDLTVVAVSIDSVIQHSFLDSINVFFSENLDRINLIWSIGVILFLLRFIFSFLYTRYLKSSAIFGNAELEDALVKIKNNTAVKAAVSIAESAQINVPLVLGHFKPLILFPVGMINALSAEEVEAIIAHELAHVKRYDYLVNMLTTLVEILFYFHPAVWWISANIKAERENCCDDFALEHQIDKVVYAKALMKLEEIKTSAIPSLAMPFSSKRHQLLNRIKRIMNMPQTQNDMREKSIATILLLSMVFLFTNQANSEAFQSPEITQEEVTAETLTLEGKDEMILTVENGKFKSLEVDDKIQKGEIIEKIASTVNKNSTDDRSYTMTINKSPRLSIVDDKVNIKGQGGVIYESDDEITSPKILWDTIPDNEWEEEIELDNKRTSKMSIATKANGKVIEMEKENGEITELIIDGEKIPKSDYHKYQTEIEEANKVSRFDGDFSIFEDFDFDMDRDFPKNFGFMFDGENWREFGGNFNQLFNEEFNEELREKLKNIEEFEIDLRGLENLEELEKLGELRGLERLGELEGLERLQELEHLDDILKELGIQMDTAFNGMNFRFHNFDNFDGFDGFEGFENFRFFDGNDFKEEENRFFRDKSDYKSGTVVDKIGKMLNKDGLLKAYKSNKVEITGKHLKINGEKMPKALFEKYKNIYQESTGAPLTKKSKMVFDVEGKPSKRKVKTF